MKKKVDPAAASAAAVAPKPYKSAGKLGRALTIMSVCIMVANVGEILTLIGLLIYGAVGDADGKTGAAAGDSVFDLLVALFGGVETLLIVVSTFTFMMWFLRLRQNIDAMGVTGLKTRTADCLNGFFVPFANLYAPFQTIQEMWRASAQSALTGDWKGEKSSKLISVWWFFSVCGLLLGSFCNIGAKGMDANSPSPELAGILFLVYLAAEAVSLVAAFLEFRVVSKLTDRQEEQYKSWLVAHPEAKGGADYVQPRVVS